MQIGNKSDFNSGSFSVSFDDYFQLWERIVDTLIGEKELFMTFAYS